MSKWSVQSLQQDTKNANANPLGAKLCTIRFSWNVELKKAVYYAIILANCLVLAKSRKATRTEQDTPEQKRIHFNHGLAHIDRLTNDNSANHLLTTLCCWVHHFPILFSVFWMEPKWGLVLNIQQMTFLRCWQKLLISEKNNNARLKQSWEVYCNTNTDIETDLREIFVHFQVSVFSSCTYWQYKEFLSMASSLPIWFIRERVRLQNVCERHPNQAGVDVLHE